MGNKLKRAYELTLTIPTTKTSESCVTWVRRTVKKVDDNAIVEVLTDFNQELSMLILFEEEYFSNTKSEIAKVVANLSIRMQLDDYPIDKIQALLNISTVDMVAKQ